MIFSNISVAGRRIERLEALGVPHVALHRNSARSSRETQDGVLARNHCSMRKIPVTTGLSFRPGTLENDLIVNSAPFTMIGASYTGELATG